MQRIIEDYTDKINQKYPQYSECTAHYSELITELLMLVYNGFPSEKKSMQFVKSKLREIITYTFTNAEVKNYLRMIISIFYLPEVKSFFSATKIDTNELYDLVDCIETRIIYWQGFENDSERHLQRLLEPLD